MQYYEKTSLLKKKGFFTLFRENFNCYPLLLLSHYMFFIVLLYCIILKVCLKILRNRAVNTIQISQGISWISLIAGVVWNIMNGGGVYTHSFVHKQSQVTIIRPWAFFHPCFPLEKISIWCQTIGKTNTFHLSVSLCTPSLSAKMRARGPSCKGSAQGKAPSNEPSSAF